MASADRYLDLAYLRSADLPAAEDELRALRERFPDNPYVLHEQVVLHARKGETAAALAVGERLEALLDGNVREGRTKDDGNAAALAHLKKRTRERLVLLRRKADCPDASPGAAANPADLRRQLYLAHEDAVRRLVGAYVGKLNLASRLGQFGFDELVDAGRDGLWEATAFYSDAVTEHFMTYAWFYVMGRVKERRTQVMRQVASSDLEPDGQTPRALQTLPYIEEQLAGVAADHKRALALATLEVRGLLTAPEQILARALRAGGPEGAVLDADLGLGLPEIKIAATTLLRKLRSYLRDDDALDATGLPAGYLPHLRPLALAKARSALHHLRAGDHVAVKPLAALPRFLVDLRALSAELGAPEAVDGQSTTGAVISIFKAASRLTMGDLSLQTGLSTDSLYQLARHGLLTARHAPAKMAALANALSIEPSEILFRALPEAAALFDRVAPIGDGVYLGLVEVEHPSELLARYLAAPRDPAIAHAFAPLARAYRLAAGASSAEDLDARVADVEAGKGLALAHVREVAARVAMHPALLLLGTWPELLGLFDVLDERGRFVHEGACDYAKLVVVLKQRPRQARTGAAPATAGLAAYLRHLVRGRARLLVPEELARHGLTQRLVAGALGGTPPQLLHVAALAEALELGVQETTRLIAEILLAADAAARAADLEAIVTGLAGEVARRDEAARVGDPVLAELAALDDADYVRLNRAFTDHFATRQRNEALAAGIAAFVDGALAVVLEQSQGAGFVRLKRLAADDAVLDLLYALWRAEALAEDEAVLVQALVLRPKNLFALVREMGVGFHAAVAAVRSLLAKLESDHATPAATIEPGGRAPRC